jgi:hypothetical protein
MRQILNILFIVLLASITYAQAPQGIPYQAVARNSSGAILASTSISLRFTIRDSVTTGTIKYRETFSVTTTAQGMFSVNVGQGTPVTGTFAGINWGSNAKFMQVEMDPAGGSSYIDMGTTQMMSVPYALSATTASSVSLTVSATGDTLYSGGGKYVIIPGVSAANCTLPSAGTISGTTTVCAGGTTTLSNTATGGVWSCGATGVATVGSTGILTGVTAGTAVISYTITNSCGSAVATQVVTVITTPSAGTISGPNTVAVSTTITLSSTVSGGTWSSSNTSVATVGTSGIVLGVAAGTVFITYAVGGSCGPVYATYGVTVSALSLTVGTSFGGGKIAYIFTPGDPGYVAGEVHGLIAANSDIGSGIPWSVSCCSITGATSSSLGSGWANTNLIISVQGTNWYAAYYCRILTDGGYTDWYLPSLDEMLKLCLNRVAIGGFSNDSYWTSTEYSSSQALWVPIYACVSQVREKYPPYGACRVRAVRSF